MRLLIFSLVIALIVTACQYDPFAKKYLTVKPIKRDIIGTYRLDFQTVDYSFQNEDLEAHDSKIIINEDNTYRIDEFPYFKEVGVLTYRFDGYMSVSGVWKIEEIGSVDYGNGQMKRHWGVILEAAPDELIPAGLLGVERPSGMIIGYGDPDEGKAILLNKE